MQIFRKKRGQVLVAGLAAVLAIFMLAFLVMETGSLAYRKMHMQNIADSAALEGGLWYARCLNIASLSNKVLACSAIVGALGGIFGCPACLKLPDAVSRLQSFFIGEGEFGKMGVKPAAMLAALSVVRNGMKNGVISAPVFNTETFGKNGLNPSLEVDINALEKSADKKVRFFYMEHSTGRRIDVPESETVVFNKEAKRWQKTNKPKFFVRREVTHKTQAKKIKDVIKMGIEETGPHTILVGCFDNEVKHASAASSGLFASKNGREIKPGAIVSTAMVRVDGGSMDVFELNGADYTPAIEHIIMPDLKDVKAPEMFAGALEFAGKALEQVTNNVLLH